MSEQAVLDFTAARVARDAGMAAAAEHADRSSSNWTEEAYAFLVDFARNNACFISEDVSDASKGVPTFVQPPTDRAWGTVYRRAVRDGVIVQDGCGRSRRRHASICPLWSSLIFRGGVA